MKPKPDVIEEEGTSLNLVLDYMATMKGIVAGAEVTDRGGNAIQLDLAVRELGRRLRETSEAGRRVFFVGNGGSAGICSHLAVDFSKNGGVRALALNDSAALTCAANDYGFEHVFAKQIEWQACRDDALVAISSSGRSRNIILAAEAAAAMGCSVYTLSGFQPDNALRRLGDLNFYLASRSYGFVEVGHLALMHGVLDIQMGWKPAGPRALA